MLTSREPSTESSSCETREVSADTSGCAVSTARSEVIDVHEYADDNGDDGQDRDPPYGSDGTLSRHVAKSEQLFCATL